MNHSTRLVLFATFLLSMAFACSSPEGSLDAEVHEDEHQKEPVAVIQPPDRTQLYPLGHVSSHHLEELKCADGRHERLDSDEGIELRCLNSSGEAHGSFVVLNQKRVPILRGKYEFGERSGAFTSYWQNGKIQQQGFFPSPHDTSATGTSIQNLSLPNGQTWISRDSKGRLHIAEKPAAGQILGSIRPTSADQLKTVNKPNGVLTDSSLKPAQELMGVLQASGSARVIVGLQAKLARETQLSKAELEAQRLTIRQKQQARLSRVGQSLESPDVIAYKTIPFVALRLDPEGLAEMLLDPEVVSISPSHALPPLLLNSVPEIGANTVWSYGFDGSGGNVAILDTGVESSHPLLAGKVTAERCFSTNSPQEGIESLCPGGTSREEGPGSAADCTDMAGCGHGTHVAGIAAGNETALKGVAPGAGIIAVQVFSRFSGQDHCGDQSHCPRNQYIDLIHALDWLYTHREALNLTVVNMSLGGGEYTQYCDDLFPPMAAIINNLHAAGIPSIIASGNDGFDGAVAFPACIQSAITVGSSYFDAVIDFSNHSSLVDLLAPGTNILSSDIGGQYTAKHGTSMAAPHAAGAFALLRQRFPEAGVDDLLSALQTTGVPLTRQGVTTPRIQVDAAFESALPLMPPTFDPPSVTFDTHIDVAIQSSSDGTRIFYTTDGSVPVPGYASELGTGAKLNITNTTQLTAVAYHDELGISDPRSATYSKRRNLTVNLEPAQARTEGAAWRLQGLTVNFDDELMTYSGPYPNRGEAWALDAPPGGAPSGRYAVRSLILEPTEPDNYQTAISWLTSPLFETEGGVLSLKYKVEDMFNSQMGLQLHKQNDDGFETRVLFATQTDTGTWREFETYLAPGRYIFDLYAFPLSADSTGTFWVDDIVMPGDRWRGLADENGQIHDNFISPLPEKEYPLVFRELPGWISPQETADLRSGDVTVNATYLPEARLQVFLEPQQANSSQAGWRVQGLEDSSWHPSGYELRLPAGSHTIEFTGNEFLKLPAPVQVEVSAGNTTQKTVEFGLLGKLQVNLEPQQARDSGAFWRVQGSDDSSWHPSGHELLLPEGSHTVEFADPESLQAPQAVEVQVNFGETTEITESYTLLGKLKVHLDPAEVLNTDARWRIQDSEDTSWYSSGHELTLPVGDYVVEFADADSLGTPAPVDVTVEFNKTTTETVSYTLLGKLKIDLEPAEVLNTDARWRIQDSEDTSWHSSGHELTLPVGDYTVEFADADSLGTPASVDVTVEFNQTTEKTVSYTLLGKLKIDLEPAEVLNTDARWRIQDSEDTSWYSSGHELTLPVGDYVVEFADAASLGTPAPVDVTVEFNKTTTETVSYTLLGKLKIDLEPAEVLNTDARWRIQDSEDTSWHSSGHELTLPVGDYVVEFSAEAAWLAPAPTPVVIDFNDTTEATATFTQRSAPSPEFGVAEGTYTSAIEVSLSVNADNAVIRYSLLPGEQVTESSQLYTGAIQLQLNSETTISARAFIDGYLPSAQVTATYRITGQVAVPTASHAPGEVPAGTLVSLQSEDDTTLRYTTDGSPVTASSPIYTSPIEIPEGATLQIRARAYRDDWAPSDELNVSFVGLEVPDEGDGSGDDGSDDGAGDGSDDGSDDGAGDGSDDGSDDGAGDASDDGSDGNSDDGSDDGSDGGSSEDEDEEPAEEAEESKSWFGCSSTGPEGVTPLLGLMLLLSLRLRRRAQF